MSEATNLLSLSFFRAGLDVAASSSTPMPPYHYPDYDSASYSDNDDFIGLLYPEEGRRHAARPRPVSPLL